MSIERIIAYKLRESRKLKESENRISSVGPEDLEEAGAFQTIHYEIVSKKTGSTIIKNFGYFSNEESFWKTMKQEYPSSRYIVHMLDPYTKKVKKIRESEEAEPYVHEEEIEEPEDLLDEETE